MFRFRSAATCLVVALLLAMPLAGSALGRQSGQQEDDNGGLEVTRTYVMPPPEIRDFLDRDRNDVSLNDLSPDGDHFVVPLRQDMSNLERMSRTTYRLAGLEFRPATRRVWTDDTAGNDRARIFSLSARTFTDIEVPADSYVEGFTWSPDGDRVAFLAHQPDATRVWVADVATGGAQPAADLAVNATVAGGGFGGGGLIQWTPEGTLLTVVVPPDLGPEPERNPVPAGPIIRTTRDDDTPTRTTRFLLETEHDADLFEHYTTSQLAEVAPGQEPRLLGEPGMYTSLSLSPDGQHLMTERMTRPFSFIVSYGSFPTVTEVVDRDGNVVSVIREEELREGRGGNGNGNGGNDPREIAWRPDGAGLTFLQMEPRPEGEEDADAEESEEQEEAEDEDDPRLDRVMLATAPFDLEQATVVVESEERLSSHVFTLGGDRVFAEVTQDGDDGLATWDLSGDTPVRVQLVDYHGGDDILDQPGELMTTRTPNGTRHARVSGDGSQAFLEGPGYTEDFRPQPFVDAVALADGTTERIFEGSEDVYERPGTPLDDDLSRMIVSRESPTMYPDDWLWSRDGTLENLTSNDNPYPEFADVERHYFQFERRDGLVMHGRIALPVGYREGQRVPGVFWTYPREYDDVEEYEQSAIRSWNYNEFPGTSTRNASDFWLALGYAVIEPDIPIVGDPYNDKYVLHMRDSVYAAIREVDRMGYVDIDRLGHGGHSYGAFATANFLAHTPFFKAGIAGDGAFNRSLTPMGFQSERRTVWEAPHIYVEMSPFFVADQIDTPMLMYHGADDDNSGTWPIQSDRMIQALTGLGKTAVLYKYPYESHGPRAIETYYDMWARWIEWFDRYVKNANAAETLTEAGQGGGR